jgi:transcriptional regulator with XRE-family HTH domain
MLATVYALAVAENKGELARLVAELLDARSMTQARLAKDSGLSESHISRIIKGDHLPAPDKLGAMAEALSVDPVMLHRAYASSVGLRLEEVKVANGDIAAVMADWPNATPEARKAALAAAKAVLDAFGRGGSQEGHA